MRPQDHIHYICLRQHGIVSAAQARAKGVSAMALVMMCQRGRLKRVSHGVYYDPLIPKDNLTPLVAATLWPRGGGAISHQTAKQLRTFGAARKFTEIHVTVEATVRSQRRVPKGIVLHAGSLRQKDIAELDGVRVLTEARVARDATAERYRALKTDGIEWGE